MHISEIEKIAKNINTEIEDFGVPITEDDDYGMSDPSDDIADCQICSGERPKTFFIETK